MDDHNSPAFWMAVSSMFAALTAAAAGVLNNWLSTKPTIKALQDQVDRQGGTLGDLSQKYKECEEHRNQVREQMEAKWPSDPDFVNRIFSAMIQAGHTVKIGDVVRFLTFRKQPSDKPTPEEKQ
jgi:hypothetical protein